MMNKPQTKKVIMASAYSDAKTKALDAASAFGKGKMISESEKMIMDKNKGKFTEFKKTVKELKPTIKSVKVMKKPM